LQPESDGLPDQKFDWCHTIYGDVKEVLPRDMPQPLGNKVITVPYTDAYLFHDMLTSRSMTGTLHLCNQMMVNWYLIHQATLETALFGSEFTAARIVFDQIIDLRTTLNTRFLGVPVNANSYMFGDNQSAVANSTLPHSSLNKQHNALAYHHVRETIAAKVLGYYWIDGKNNPADVVSKHWGYQQVWQLLKPLLFYSGNTFNLVEEIGETIKNIKESTTAPQESLQLLIHISNCTLKDLNAIFFIDHTSQLNGMFLSYE
jgi:hypothetical protein